MLWRMQVWRADINQPPKPLIQQSASLPALTSSRRAAPSLWAPRAVLGELGAAPKPGACYSFLPIRDKSGPCGGTSSSRRLGRSWPGEWGLAGRRWAGFPMPSSLQTPCSCGQPVEPNGCPTSPLFPFQISQGFVCLGAFWWFCCAHNRQLEKWTGTLMSPSWA